MAVVWKQPVWMPTGAQRTSSVCFPRGSTLLSVGWQGEQIVVWALVRDRDAPIETLGLVVVNTGDDFEMTPGCRFLGTLANEFGTVWHVWAV